MKHSVTGSILVTGGTGFVGSHLVELLVSRGHEVTCLVRDPGTIRWLKGQQVSLVQGDCSDRNSLEAAVRNASTVYHVAGLTKAARRRDYYAVNHIGTRNLLDACAHHGSKTQKFVLVSSLAAAGPAQAERPVKATDTAHPVSDYGRSKLLAEEETLKFSDRFPVVILRPSAVYGPRDTDVFELFRWAAKGYILDMSGSERYLNWCYVKDLAEALVMAGEKAVPSGSVYFVAEDRIHSMTGFQKALQESGGVTAKVIKVPVWAGYLIGLAAEAAGLLSGRTTIISRQKVREAAQRYWTCDLDTIRDDLGFQAAMPLERGLSETWKWYRENGWVG
ncbi:MAG: NAD-dependent epimerase/dehydratase family protein [Nitrospirota bacterium]